MYDMETPFFLIHEDGLRANIRGFEDACKKYWPNHQVAYSVKTNSTPWILKWMHRNGVFAEVVSDEEYELALLCEFNGDQIVFNGPIKTDDYLNRSFSSGSIVNIDSEHELEYIEREKPEINGNLGIRLNMDPTIFDKQDVEFQSDGFRFGFGVENGEFGKVVNLLEGIYHNRSFGLHLHINSITRSVNVYRAIARYTAGVIREYNLTPAYVDIGGGFFGGVPGKATPDDYISVIRNELSVVVDTKTTKLIIEPGSAAVGSCVDLYTSVIDVKDTGSGRIVTTDGSRIHIDPLWLKKGYLHRLETTGDQASRQVICGYTCMDHDRLMVLENEPELSVGDRIIYEKVGNYTMTFGGPFIRYFPDAYIEEDGKILRIRKRISVQDYYDIQSCE